MKKISRLIVLILILGACPIGLAGQPEYNREVSYQESLSRNPYSADICNQLIEARQLEHYSRFVRRLGESLILRLTTGDSLVLSNNRVNGEGCVVYSFRLHFREIGYFLIQRAFYEGWDYLMISDKTGKEVAIDGLPVLSPDMSRFVTTVTDLIAGYRPNRVQIWNFTVSGIISEWSSDSGPNSGFDDAVWIDSVSIGLNKVVGETDKKIPALLKKGNNGWEFSDK